MFYKLIDAVIVYYGENSCPWYLWYHDSLIGTVQTVQNQSPSSMGRIRVCLLANTVYAQSLLKST